MNEQRLAIFMSFSGEGGVEHMVMNLLDEFCNYPLEIDLLTIRANSRHLRQLDDRIRWLPFKSTHALTSIPELVKYLRRNPPAAMLAVKDRAGRAAIMARWIAGAKTRLAVRLGTHLSASLTQRPPWQRWSRTWAMPLLYKGTDLVIAISQGVAEDTHRLTGLPMKRIRVIRNPVITGALLRLSAEPVPHAWLSEDRPCPVIMGAGRLTHQKDFPTLLKAFAVLRQQRPLRLIILGEGKERSTLEALACELGIEEDLLLPGFQENPYRWMARADLFALSSRWEGSGNVLTEAMALGVPVVSTNCPSGPGEMLQDGRIAPLVPVGDSQSLAEAMANVLASPPDTHLVHQAVQDYTAEISAFQYLKALGLQPESS
ncbi:MAG: glycosyltransferase [Chromatiales bacterium]|jgi:glycosyltransferase involved in cell wall biosynthesis